MNTDAKWKNSKDVGKLLFKAAKKYRVNSFISLFQKMWSIHPQSAIWLQNEVEI